MEVVILVAQFRAFATIADRLVGLVPSLGFDDGLMSPKEECPVVADKTLVKRIAHDCLDRVFVEALSANLDLGSGPPGYDPSFRAEPERVRLIRDRAW